ncbi:MAG: hypothetical protein Q9216_005872 [Gyalolechia sp. 2 TL-2023]
MSQHLKLIFVQIDWEAVANELQITNGHAARMRYSRFKQQMEGTISTTRKPRVSGPRKRKENADGASKPAKKLKKDNKSPAEDQKFEDSQAMSGVESSSPFIQSEPLNSVDMLEPLIKPEQSIKPEPDVKLEKVDPGLSSSTLLNNKETSTGPWSITGNPPDPLPATEEELEASAMIDPALTASAADDPVLLAPDLTDPAPLASVGVDSKEPKIKTETEYVH